MKNSGLICLYPVCSVELFSGGYLNLILVDNAIFFFSPSFYFPWFSSLFFYSFPKPHVSEFVRTAMQGTVSAQGVQASSDTCGVVQAQAGSLTWWQFLHLLSGKCWESKHISHHPRGLLLLTNKRLSVGYSGHRLWSRILSYP